MADPDDLPLQEDRKSTRLNSSHGYISYAVFCLKKKIKSGRFKKVPNQQLQIQGVRPHVTPPLERLGIVWRRGGPGRIEAWDTTSNGMRERRPRISRNMGCPTRPSSN